MKKIFIAFLMGMVTFLAMVSVSADNGFYTYTVSNNEVTITGAVSKDEFKDIQSIPETIDGMTVKKIDSYAFENCINLKQISIPDCVESIGSGAFRQCINLTKVDLPGKLETIEAGLFSTCCSLSSVKIPDTVKKIERSAFWGCSLYSISLPSGITEISDSAFAKCSQLHSVAAAGTIISIGESSFEECSALRDIFDVSSVNKIGDRAFYNCTKLETSLIFNSINSLGTYAFYHCEQINSIILRGNLTQIQLGTFAGCKNLTEFVIPQNIKYIGASAFGGCKNLQRVIIPVSVLNIDDSAFYNTDIDIAYYEGTENEWKQIDIVDTLIKYCAKRYSCNKGVCGENVQWEYSNCVIEIYGSGEISSNTWSIYNSCTYIVDIKNGVTSIANGVFANCSNIECVYIPNSVSSIGDYSFSGTSLKNVTIPANTTFIGNRAFGYCKALKEIAVEDANEKFVSMDGVLYSKDMSVLIKYPSLSEHSSYSIPRTVTRIANCAFTYCNNFDEITIPNSVFTMGTNVFYGCKTVNIEAPIHLKANESSWLGIVNSSSVSYYCTVYYNGDYEGNICIALGKNAALPTAPIGYTYLFTVDGLDWTGENITEDVTVTVTKVPLNYTVTYSGDFEGNDSVAYANDVQLPVAPEGYIYKFTVNGNEWDGKNITSDVNVTVTKLCDMVELVITNLEKASTVENTVNGEYYGQMFTPEITTSDGASYKLYKDSVCADETTEFILAKGINTFYIKVIAESGKEEIYTVTINRNIPNSLGNLTVVQTIGGSLIFKTQNSIIGSPAVKVLYGTDMERFSEEAYAEFDAQNQTIYISGLNENTEYYFKAIAIYDDISVESNIILEKTGVTLSSDCYVLQTLTPPNGAIEQEKGTISGLRVTNKFSAITVNVIVSAGATWDIYYTETSNIPIANKTLTLFEGMSRTAYIKVKSEDGNHTKTYSINIYRQSKSSVPTIQIANGLVTITADNSKIIYTTDGSEPSELNGLTYVNPIAVTSGTVIKAIAKQNDKDEYSDVITSIAEQAATTMISELMIVPNGSNTYSYEFYIESSDAISGTFFVALYDNNDKLLGLTKDIINTTESEYLATGTVTANLKPAYYKAFLWECASNMMPLADSVSNNIE